MGMGYDLFHGYGIGFIPWVWDRDRVYSMGMGYDLFHGYGIGFMPWVWDRVYSMGMG